MSELITQPARFAVETIFPLLGTVTTADAVIAALG